MAGRGAISLLMTDSAVETMSPLGRNQEGGPLTQAEAEGGESVHCNRTILEKSGVGWGAFPQT